MDIHIFPFLFSWFTHAHSHSIAVLRLGVSLTIIDQSPQKAHFESHTIFNNFSLFYYIQHNIERCAYFNSSTNDYVFKHMHSTELRNVFSPQKYFFFLFSILETNANMGNGTLSSSKFGKNAKKKSVFILKASILSLKFLFLFPMFEGN